MMNEDEVSNLSAENEALKLRLSLAEDRLRELGEPRTVEGQGNGAEAEAGETRYRQIVESAVDYGIVATDLDGIVTDWNEAAETITGWSSRQIVGRSIATIFAPEDVENEVHLREMRFSLSMGKARDERWHMRANGERFFASGQMMPLYDDDDRPIGFLKILRDRTSEENNRRELETSRERLQFALDASGLVGTWDWDVGEDKVYADARFAAMYGIDAERAAAGVPFETYADGIHADDRDRIAASVAQALAHDVAFSEEYRTIDSAGTVRCVIARGRCFRDAKGQPIRFPGVLVDLTAERKRAARQVALLQIGDDLLSASGPLDYTPKALGIIGRTLELGRVGYGTVDAEERQVTIVDEWTRGDMERLTGRFELSTVGSDFVEALRAGQIAIEDIRNHPLTGDSMAAWERLGVAAFVNLAVVEQGRVRVILYLHDDKRRVWDEEEIAFVREVLNRSWSFSQRRRAEKAVVDAETRLRLAHEAADIGTFDFDLRTDVLQWDAGCRAAFGIFDTEPVSYEGTFLPGLHPDDRDATIAAVAVALDPAGDGRFSAVYRTIGRDDGMLRHVHASGQTVVEEGECVRFVGAVRDVTAEKEVEERQQLLTRELQHRVKNTLAMVNALANQTLRRAANAQDGLAAFSARLIALSHAHDILTQTSWTSAPIAAIVEQSLGTHQDKGARRFVWSGPDVRLNAKQSLALALALHELATNAAKYGALSNDDGIVTIGWSIEARPEHRLIFEWRETGGPPVTAPAARGFGSRLIEQSLAAEFGGKVDLSYDQDGVVCRIDAPMRDGEPAVGS